MDTRFGKFKPKPGYEYLYIKFPRDYKLKLSGRACEIYSTEGGFFIKVDGVKAEGEKSFSLDKRVETLESKIDEIYTIIKGEDTEDKPKSSSFCQKRSSPEQIRTAVAGSRVPHD